MSLVASAGLPQPSLAWQFESSNVDSVTGLAPSSTVGAPTYVPGKYGQAIQFVNTPPTSSQALYYTIPSSVGSMVNGLTVSFWLNPQSLPNAQNQTYVYIDGPIVGSTGAFWMFMNNGTTTTALLYGQNPSGGGYYPGVNGPVVPQGSWTHMTGVWTPYTGTSNTMTLYVNGVFAQSIYYANSFTINRLTLATNGGSRGSPCIIDDLRIFNTALTAVQVQAIYNAQGRPSQGTVQVSPATLIPLPAYISSNVTGTNITGSTLQPFSSFGNASIYMNTDPNTYITWAAATLASATNFTLETWTNYKNFTNASSYWNGGGKVPCLFNDVATGTLNRFYFGPTVAGTVGLYYWNNSQDIYAESSITIAVNTWNHIALTYDGTTYRIFINGVLAATNTMSGSGMLIPNGLRIGSHKFTVQSPNANVNAYIASSRFVNGAIVYPTSSTTLGTTVFTPPTAPLTTYPSGTTTMLLNVQNSPFSLSGTPLFSQLSTSATASAVGAFSLRAVNGTTARAVQVKQIQIVDSSSSPLVPTLTNATSNVLGPFSPNGSIFFNVGSAVFPTTGKMQFDLFTSGNVFMECFLYISSAPTINFPAVFFKLGQLSFYFDNSSTLRLSVTNATGGNAMSPLTVGSVSLSTWTHVSVSINQTTSTIYASVNGTVVSSVYSLGGSNYNSSNPFYLVSYNYPTAINVSNFRCVKGSSTLPYISSGFTIPTTTLTAFGTGTTLELLDGTAYIQDFWADRLGNLLTAPVTGQKLVDWLGGATGYVTTWYDQSGAGNHATQATAANQPKIDTVNKWMDFKTSAWFNLPNGTVPYGNTNYTMVVRHNTINSGLADIISSGTQGTANAANSLEYNSTSPNYWNYWWANDLVAGTYSPGNIVTAKYNNTVGRTLYVNGTSAGTNSSTVRNSTNLNNFIGTDPRNRYLNGELYYVFIFSTSLSDADRQLVEALPIS